MKGRFYEESVISRRAEKKAWKSTLKVIKWLKNQSVKFSLDEDYMEERLMDLYPDLSPKNLTNWMLPSRSTGWQLKVYLKTRVVSVIYSPTSYGAERGLLEVANFALSGTDEEDEGVVTMTAEDIINRVNSVEFADGPYAPDAFAPATFDVA